MFLFLSNREIKYKIGLVGESGVGKSCLLVRWVDNDFFEADDKYTIGVDFKYKTVQVKDKSIKLQIHDTGNLILNYYPIDSSSYTADRKEKEIRLLTSTRSCFGRTVPLQDLNSILLALLRCVSLQHIPFHLSHSEEL